MAPRSNPSRRSFLKTLAGASAAAVVAPALGCASETPPDEAAIEELPSEETTAGVAPEAAVIPVGTQLYCVRHQMAEDAPGTLKAIADIGFEGVEFADYFDYSAQEWRQMLDDNGLRCCGTHIYLEDMLGDNLPATVAFNQALGNEYLIVRWLGDELRSSPEAFQQTIDRFNEIAERLEPHGMHVGYHNHDYIFETFDGKMLWDILGDQTHDDVILQLDTGNAAQVSGVSPVELIERHPGRTVTMHVKPYSATDEMAYLGADDLNWPRILDLTQTMGGTEWYIIEYEKEGIPPLEALKANYEIFQEMRA